MRQFLHVNPADNVAVAFVEFPAGTSLSVAGRLVTLRETVPAGHKFALVDLPAGTPVIKYAGPIGRTTRAVSAGEWVHEHNLATALSGELEYAWNPSPEAVAPDLATAAGFDGYVREDGRVGIRNEIWIIPTVGCVNAIADRIKKLAGDPPPGVDDVVVFSHPYGCSQLGDDHENTRRMLAALARHPNAGGVLVIGLGCENNTMASFRELLGPVNPDRVKFLVAQEVQDEVSAGVALIRSLMDRAKDFRRQPVPLSALRLGLKCGGSDGYSGLTANPLLGVICDRVNAAGGATVLTEVPEMFGAEQPLLDRCANRAVFDRAVTMINRFKNRFLEHGHPVSENPSPGNRKGGITTLEEKSLGCVQKGGRSRVTAVLDYGASITEPGLNLLDGPGNDIVAVTALAAAGCQLILFTTGRGTPLGSPVPVLKFATNPTLAQFKSTWIDFNAGRLLDGGDMPTLADEALALCRETASGRLTAAEKLGLRDFAIWRGGVTL